MADKLPAVINYLIGIGLMITVLLVLEQKRKAQPDFSVFGLKFSNLKMMIYAGIAIFAILAIVAIVN
jgi:hypothetical protein